MTVNSNNTLNQMIQKIQKISKTQETNETNKSSTLAKEEYENKKEPAGRYNFLTANGWLDNSQLVKDEKLNTAFREYVDNLTLNEFSSLLISMAGDFLPGMGDNKDLLPLHLAPSRKNPNIEMATLSTMINYYQNEHASVTANAAKWGGDVTDTLNMITNMLNFLRDYESKEQENQYKSLGQSSNNNY